MRVVQQRHASLTQLPAAFTVVAGRTGRYHIGPYVLSSKVARDDVIDGQVMGFLAAVLAGEIVTPKDLTAAKSHPAARSVHHLPQADNRGAREGVIDGVNHPPTVNYHRCALGQEKSYRPAHIAHIDRLEIGVENKNAFVHGSLFRLIIAPVLYLAKILYRTETCFMELMDEQERVRGNHRD